MSEHPNLLKSVLIFTNPKGQHNSSLAYQKMDEVQHQTSIYVASEDIPAGVAIGDSRWVKKLDNSTAYQAEQARKDAEVEREQAEEARETAEGLREQGETARNNDYTQAELERDGLYSDAESARDGLFTGAQQDRTSAYNLRENQRDDAYGAAELERDGLFNAAELLRTRESGAATEVANDAAERADAISETLEGLAPKWADADISVSALPEGSEPTADIAQDETGTSISLGIPKGDTGNGIVSVNRTAGDGTPGSTDTYTIQFDEGATTFPVYNGADAPSLAGVHQYIIRWDKINSQCVRMGDAASISTDITNFCHRGTVNESYDNPFDDLYPWKYRKLCKVDRVAYAALTPGSSVTDAVTMWEGEPGFALDGTGDFDGVYTPEFWGRIWEDGTYVYAGVADGPIPGWQYFEATIGGRYHASMDASGNLTSRAGDIAARRIAMSTLHSNAKGQKMTLDDIFTWSADTLLLCVEYATLNTQSAIGDGASSVYRGNAEDLCQIAEMATNRVVLPSAFLPSAIPGAVLDIGTSSEGLQVGFRTVVAATDLGDGQCEVVFDGDPIDTLTTHYCSIHGMSNTPDAAIGSKSGYIGTNTKSIAYYRGRIAHGNYWRYVLGAYRQTGTGKIWTAADRAQANDHDALNTDVHIDTGKVLPQGADGAATSGYINALHIVPTLPLAPFGSEMGGNSSNPIGDYIYIPATGTGNTVLLAGGDAYSGARVGRFSGIWSYAASDAGWFYAALLFLKTP